MILHNNISLFLLFEEEVILYFIKYLSPLLYTKSPYDGSLKEFISSARHSTGWVRIT